MKYLSLLQLLVLLSINTVMAQQKVVAECTISYAIAVDSNSTDISFAENLKSATKTVFIKGSNCRVDIVSKAFLQSIFYDKAKGGITILREFGNNKFITKLDSAKWRNENMEFDSMTTIITQETKKIIGYDCKKVVLELKNGTIYQVYFAQALVPSVKEFEYEFKSIPGLVLAYFVQSKDGKKINYTATKLNLSPVPASKFDIPVTGYRLLEK
ncbi:MAG: hypothetical protein H7101_06755 [Deinococcales bacterium]|nr:hypothetical protein [Chitinophagaceae bacterium]